MANTDGLIYRPVSTQDIADVLGVTDQDIGYLVSNYYNKVNMFAKFKPVYREPRPDAQCQDPKGTNYVPNLWKDYIGNDQEYFYENGIMIPRVDANTDADHLWLKDSFYKPPYRLWDFDQYYHNALPCIGVNMPRDFRYGSGLSFIVSIVDEVSSSSYDNVNLSVKDFGIFNDYYPVLYIYNNTKKIQVHRSIGSRTIAQLPEDEIFYFSVSGEEMVPYIANNDEIRVYVWATQSPDDSEFNRISLRTSTIYTTYKRYNAILDIRFFTVYYQYTLRVDAISVYKNPMYNGKDIRDDDGGSHTNVEYVLQLDGWSFRGYSNKENSSITYYLVARTANPYTSEGDPTPIIPQILMYQTTNVGQSQVHITADDVDYKFYNRDDGYNQENPDIPSHLIPIVDFGLVELTVIAYATNAQFTYQAIVNRTYINLEDYRL